MLEHVKTFKTTLMLEFSLLILIGFGFAHGIEIVPIKVFASPTNLILFFGFIYSMVLLVYWK